MSSIFSFIRPPEPEPEPEVESLTAPSTDAAADITVVETAAAVIFPAPVPALAGLASVAAGSVAVGAAAAFPAPIPPVGVAAFSIASLTSVEQVPAAIVAGLAVFLSAPLAGLPAPGVLILNISDRMLGLGNFRGLESRGIFPAVELKGGHAQAVIRFQLWGNTPEEVNAATLALQGQLMAARADLWDAGFLEMSGIAGTLATQPVSPGPWTRTADYQTLYEYHLAPTAGAESLIARIPIQADQEVSNSTARETTVVTDETVRWDELSAPTLLLRGSTRIARFSMLVYFPAALAGGPVTLLRTHDGAASTPGAAGLPTNFTSLSDFLDALADPASPAHHAQFAFASLNDFLSACTPAGDPFPLGDWDGDSIPDIYQSVELELDPPVQLTAATDRLEISPGTSPLNQVGVVYLHASRS